MSKKCENCGNEIEEGSPICLYCGSAVKEEVKAEVNETADVQDTLTEEKEELLKKAKTFRIIGLVLMLLVLIDKSIVLFKILKNVGFSADIISIRIKPSVLSVIISLLFFVGLGLFIYGAVKKRKIIGRRKRSGGVPFPTRAIGGVLCSIGIIMDIVSAVLILMHEFDAFNAVDIIGTVVFILGLVLFIHGRG